MVSGIDSFRIKKFFHAFSYESFEILDYAICIKSISIISFFKQEIVINATFNKFEHSLKWS